MIEGLRNLDVGGLPDGNLELAIFYGFADDNPSDEYVIADPSVRLFTRSNSHTNLFIVSPGIEKSRVPLLSRCRLPFSNGYFDHVRMDMVIDSLTDPEMRLRVFLRN